MTTKLKITSISQPSPIKQYKDQQYLPNIALKNPLAKLVNQPEEQKAHDHLA